MQCLAAALVVANALGAAQSLAVANKSKTPSVQALMQSATTMWKNAARANETLILELGQGGARADHEAKHRQVYEANMQWAANSSNCKVSCGEHHGTRQSLLPAAISS